ncbi:MAG: sulfatase/phosphatase domain-containing protein, partial [Planctomycetota bacterium]
IGLEPTGDESGRDASPLIRGENVDWTDEAYFHHSHFDFTGVFTPEYELALARNGEQVLWDRVDDPDQMRNVYGDPAHAEVVDELKARVIEHNRAVGSPALHTWLLGYDGRPAV